MQASSDHQVEDQPEIAFEADGDALADAPQLADRAALEVLKGRVHGAKEKRAGKANAFEGFVKDARFEGGEIGGDVGELGHE